MPTLDFIVRSGGELRPQPFRILPFGDGDHLQFAVLVHFPRRMYWVTVVFGKAKLGAMGVNAVVPGRTTKP